MNVGFGRSRPGNAPLEGPGLKTAPEDSAERSTWSIFSTERNTVGVLVALGGIAALFEAGTLLVIIPLLSSLSEDILTIDQSLGPIPLPTSVLQLWILALIMVVLLTLLKLLTSYLTAKELVAWEMRVRGELICLHLTTNFSAQSSEKSGRLQELSNIVGSSSRQLAALILGGRSLITVLVLVAAAALVDWRASVVITILGGMLFSALRPIVNRIRRLEAEAALQRLRHGEDLSELDELSMEIRIFDASQPFRVRVLDRLETLLELNRQSHFLNSTLSPLYQAAGLFAILVALGLAQVAGGVELAGAGGAVLLVYRSLSYGQAAQSQYTAYRAAEAQTRLMLRAFDGFRRNVHKTGSRALSRINQVRLVNVRYSYFAEDTSDAIKGVTLNIEKGEVVGVVGPSGAGKSTLAQLLTRLRYPSAGSIEINGKSIAEYSDTSWSQNLALVPQHTVVFAASVAENIRMYRDHVAHSDVVSAAKLAGIHDTIISLDDGYETAIGGSDRGLSGGQIQRLGIARALAGRPSMIILDEPTSSLDARSERIIQETIESLAGSMIIVVIAHRMSTLNSCSRILVLENGQLVADGERSAVSLKNEYFRTS